MQICIAHINSFLHTRVPERLKNQRIKPYVHFFFLDFSEKPVIFNSIVQAEK